MSFSGLSAYEAFCKAHRSIIDSALKHSADEYRKRFLRAKYALHLAYSPEEISEACVKFLDTYPHKL